MSKAYIAFIVMTTFLFVPDIGSAGILNVPGDHATIQAAIAAAGSGDEIVISAGTYSEPITTGSMFDLVGRTNLTIRGEGTVILDALSGGRVFFITESIGIRLENLTIRNGSTAGVGGGVATTEWSTVEIVDCRLESCQAVAGGGVGNLGEGGSLTLDSCVLVGNQAGSGGGLRVGLFWDVTVSNCLFHDNEGTSRGGAINRGFDENSLSVDNTLFTDNRAPLGGWMAGGSLCGSFTNCTFIGDPENPESGGFDFVYGGGGCGFLRCIIFGSGASTWMGGIDSVDASCTDIYGNQGGDWLPLFADQLGIEGNINEDPLFCDPESGDYSIDASSPCSNLVNDCGLMGALPVVCGLTGVEDPPDPESSSFSAVKSLY